MKLPRRKSSLLKKQLNEKDQTITQLTEELQEKNRLIESLAQSYAAHDLSGMFDGLRKTLSEQIDKTRNHGSQQYWDLLERLELGHSRIEKLQTFIAVTMRHIGRLEGQIRSSGRVVFSDTESRDVIAAAETYQNAIQTKETP